MKKRPPQYNGYITLLSVLFISAIVGTAALALLRSGIGSAKSSLSWEQSVLARAYTSACAEVALEQIRANNSFSGNSTLTFERGTCQYDVAKLLEQNRTIKAIGTAGTNIRKSYISVDKVQPSISVVSWQEVADFP